MADIKKQETKKQEKCSLCPIKTFNISMYDLYICECCENKYGHRLRDKLIQLDLIKSNSDDWKEEGSEDLDNQEIKIEGSISFGNKRSAIEMINQLRCQFDISVEEIERFEF